MTDLLFNLTIGPLQLIYEIVYNSLHALTHNYGWALILLSFVTTFITVPLGKAVSNHIKKERLIESILEPQLKKIKSTSSGAEQSKRIRNLYKRYAYNPLYSVRLAFGVLIQLPFLIGAYWMIAEHPSLKGISFGPIADLSQPDHLLGEVNLLPLIMTIANLGVVAISTKMPKRDRIQAIVIAVLFLFLLYSAPSALLIYWTGNNVILFLRAFTKKEFPNFYFSIGKVQGSFWEKISSFFIFIYNKIPSEFFIIFLCVLTPISVIWANNCHKYTLMTTLCTLTAVIISVGILTFFTKFINKTILIIIGGVLFAFFAQTTTLAIMGSFNFLTYIIFPTLLYALYKLTNLKTVYISLTSVIFVAFVLGQVNYLESVSKTKIVNNFPLIKVENRPNIYILLCESYHNLNLMEKIYGLKDSTFLNNLNDNHFKIFNNVYSNQAYTLGTLMNLFTWSPRIQLFGQGDANQEIRDTISGGRNNFLFRFLKYNDYETSFYIKGDSYFFSKKGPYLDFSDTRQSKIVEDYFAPIMESNPYLSQFNKFVISNRNDDIEKDNVKIVQNFFKRPFNTKPQFFMLKVGADHTPSNGEYSYINRNDWVLSGRYQDMVLKGNREIEKIIEIILHNDSQGVIVLLGDHGAWRLRGIENDGRAKSITTLLSRLKAINETFEDYVNDKHYVFAAIRMPEGRPFDIGIFSPANIMLKLFKVLNPDNLALNSIQNPENQSYDFGWLPFVEDAEIQDAHSILIQYKN